MTRWGSRNRYFGRDRQAATQSFAASMAEWADWRNGIETARIAPPKTRFRVIELAEQFIASKTRERGDDLGRYYRKHLKRFLHAVGGAYADKVNVRDLEALKVEMLRAGYAAKTCNHDVVAARAMLQWAMNMEYIPTVALAGCKILALGPPADKSLSIKAVKAWVNDAPEPVRPWLAVNYLTLARPIEVVRMVNGQGVWSEAGVMRLDNHKTALVTQEPRHVVFSELALKWFEQCEPVWSRLDSYSAAVRHACGKGGPHPLRHSGATHLLDAEVSREEVDCILGHLPRRVSRIYARINWQSLRVKVRRLSL